MLKVFLLLIFILLFSSCGADRTIYSNNSHNIVKSLA